MLSLKSEPRKSVIPGKLVTLDEGVTKAELALKQYNPNKVAEERRKTIKPKPPVLQSNDEEEDVKSLDSDEERCCIVDPRNAQDKHFFC